METPKRKNQRIIMLAYEDIERLMRGQLQYSLPVDAEIEKVRDSENFGCADIFIRSIEFNKTARYATVPRETMVCEQIVSLNYRHAHSLREMLKFYKDLILAGQLTKDEYRSTGLTTEYCNELIGALDVQ